MAVRHAAFRFLVIVLWATGYLYADSGVHKFALVVGIDHYASQRWKGLNYAEADAHAVAQKLRDQGFQVKELRGAEATHDAVMDALNDLSSRMDGDDSFLFFFAGHGTSEIASGKKWGYLVPFDGDRTTKYISRANLEEISARMSNALHQLFILDACYSGLISSRSGGYDPTLPDYIQRVQTTTSREIMAAGTEDQEVLDSAADGHSVFTSAFLEAIAGKADFNGDGYVTLPELQAYLEGAASNAYQTPSSSTLPGHKGGEFVFVSPLGAKRLIRPAPIANDGVTRGDSEEASATAGGSTLTSLRTSDAAVDPLAKAKEALITSKFGPALTLFKDAADKGNPDACFYLGTIYKGGLGVPQDYAQARSWFEKAANAKRTEAIVELGNLYANGQGGPQDFAKARDLYSQAAAAGNVRGMVGLGVLTERGKGVAQDYEQARQWYEKAAAGGSTDGLTKLGFLYENGRGVNKDYATARGYFEKAAAAGDPRGFSEIGYQYDHGWGVAQDFVQARQWYEKAAAAGSPLGMNNVGALYEHGRGVPQDYTQARQWYERAAAAGNTIAMLNLGKLYAYSKGVPQDYAEARHWFENSATSGNIDAMVDLGLL